MALRILTFRVGGGMTEADDELGLPADCWKLNTAAGVTKDATLPST